MDISLKRKEYQLSLESSIDRIKKIVRDIPEIHKVISIGSYSRGKRDLFTDLDLIVIMDTEKDFVQRTADLYQLLQCGVDLDLLVYTPEEFHNMQEGNFLRKALQDGQVIYEK